MKNFDDAKILMVLNLAYPTCYVFYFTSFLAMKRPRGKGVINFQYNVGPPHMALNEATKTWKDFDAVLLTEWDHQFPQDGLEKLWNDNKPVVSGMYRSRRAKDNEYILMNEDPKTNVMTGYVKPPKERLFTIDATGLGFMLIRKEVLEKLKPPFFEMGQEGKDNFDRMWCRKLREHGFKIWIDQEVKLGHWISEMKW